MLMLVADHRKRIQVEMSQGKTHTGRSPRKYQIGSYQVSPPVESGPTKCCQPEKLTGGFMFRVFFGVPLCKHDGLPKWPISAPTLSGSKTIFHDPQITSLVLDLWPAPTLTQTVRIYGPKVHRQRCFGKSRHTKGLEITSQKLRAKTRVLFAQGWILDSLPHRGRRR